MNLQVFENNLGSIRVLGDKQNPLFCLRDVCEALELSTPARVLEAINTEFGDGVSLTHPIKDALGREQNATFITEPQLYFVLMRSDKPKAKPFRKWICEEVIPSIRKYGVYATPEKAQEVQEVQESIQQTLTLMQSQIMELQNQVMVLNAALDIKKYENEQKRLKQQITEQKKTLAVLQQEYREWTQSDDEKLTDLLGVSRDYHKIAALLGRNHRAVKQRALTLKALRGVEIEIEIE